MKRKEPVSERTAQRVAAALERMASAQEAQAMLLQILLGDLHPVEQDNAPVQKGSMIMTQTGAVRLG